MNIMNNTTYSLAVAELEKYNIEAELLFDHTLPAFEIRRINGKTQITAPDEIELLYGVYEFAERFGGWSFFEPGRDRFDAARKTAALPEGVLIKATKPLLKRRGFIQEFPFNSETEDATAPSF